MPREIRFKSNTLLGLVVMLVGAGIALLVLLIPDIKREIRLWTM